jgi:hypothetical protein
MPGALHGEWLEQERAELEAAKDELRQREALQSGM